jgi:predicted dehydrogenase
MTPGIAIIGSGYWGINYVRLLSQLADAHLVGVCDKSEERLKMIAGQFCDTEYFTSVDQLLAMDGIDGVIVCTNPDSHYEVARTCLEAGKHVLVEKPLTVKSNDAQELTDLANLKNLVLMVGHIFLYNAGVTKLKSYIDSGEIGDIRYLYSQRTNLGPIRKDVSALWDLATHDIYIFNYLLGSSPETVNAVGARFLNEGLEDVGFVTLHYPNGIIGNIHVSWANPHKEREIVIVGSNQRLSFNDIDAREPLRVFQKGVAASTEQKADFGEYKLLIRDGDIIIPKIEASEPLKNQVRHFINCFQNGAKPLSDGYAGLQVVETLQAIDQSIQNNGAPVALPKHVSIG